MTSSCALAQRCCFGQRSNAVEAEEQRIQFPRLAATFAVSKSIPFLLSCARIRSVLLSLFLTRKRENTAFWQQESNCHISSNRSTASTSCTAQRCETLYSEKSRENIRKRPTIDFGDALTRRYRYYSLPALAAVRLACSASTQSAYFVNPSSSPNDPPFKLCAKSPS